MNKIVPSASTKAAFDPGAAPTESEPDDDELDEIPSFGSRAIAFLFDLITLRPSYPSKAHDWFRHFLGFPYVALTLFFSVRFLVVSQSALQNDLFWSYFNATSGGIYVANAFNTMLMGRQHEPIKLSRPEYAIVGTMSSAKPHVTFSSLYPSILLYHRLNTAEHAIASLRRPESNSRLLFKLTQFCWVDLDRHFSLAHTAKRAERCRLNDKTNGAVYFETYMRNFDAKHFLNAWGTAYACGIQQPLQESAEGRAFLDTIESIWNKSVHFTASQELAYWQSKGITHFTMQRGNVDLPGLTEHIEFVSALGVRVNFTIKTITPTISGQRTSDKMFWTPLNDFWAVSSSTTNISGMSLVRGTSQFYENFNITMEQVMINDGDFPFPFTPTDQIVRQVIGPLGSIDMKHLIYPDSLFDLFMNTTRIINENLLSNEDAQKAYISIPEQLQYKVVPLVFRPRHPDTNELVWSYIAGNPLCSNGASVVYLHKYIDYSESCSETIQESVKETRVMFVLALLALGNPKDSSALETLCTSGMLDVPKCMNNTITASQFINTYLPEKDQEFLQSLAAKTHQELLQINAQLIQFVVNNSNDSQYELLRQPLLASDPHDPWNFFGWWYAIEWVTGLREVIRMEGDEGTINLISARAILSTLDLHGTEIPTSMSVYFLRIVQYTTVVSIVCASLALFYAIANKGYIAGSNLLRFNRVTGAVWIGRPLVLARGIVAVCMISTSEAFLKLHHGMTKFDETRKAWYNVIITAGESCWFSYVAVDFFVTVTQGYTYRYAPVSSTLVQILNAVVDLVMPFEHTAEIHVQCEMVSFYQEVVCRSGLVEIGSLTRFMTISGVAIGITLLMFLLLRVTMDPICVLEGGKMLLSGIAKEVFISDGWVHDGRWYLDKSSALLAGLVTFNFGRHSRVLDVKTWTLLYLKNNRLTEVAPQECDASLHKLRDPSTTTATNLPTKLKYGIALAINIGNDVPPPLRKRSDKSKRSVVQ